MNVDDNNDPKGIDPELIPYLLAAEDDDADQVETEAQEDDAHTAALRALLENSLLAGPDPEILAELANLGRGTEEDDVASREEEAIRGVEVRRRLAEFGAMLAQRAPENDFEPTLTRVTQILDILGDPQEAYPSVHLAGTNGKTSTSRMIDALLSAFDLRVGRYTSPHLRELRERISVEGQPLAAEQFLAAWDDIEPYVGIVDAQCDSEGRQRLSSFEILTVMAFAAFSDYPVDVAVIECGMGGQWDATNVLNSGVCVITPVAMDHQNYLGDSLDGIAGEKAGIIKDRSIVVIMGQEPSAEQILLERCRETDSIARLEGRDWEVLSRQPGVGGQLISVRTPAGVYEELFIPLHGEHQAHNAAAALVATEAMMGGQALSAEIVEAGFHAVTSPGRLEVVRRSPTVVVDAAHNPHGVRALKEAMEEVFHFEYLVGLFSAMGDKSIEEMLVEIEPILDELVVVELPGTRSVDLDDLVGIAEDVFGPDRVHRQDDMLEALDRAAELVDATVDPEISKGIVAFGSVVLAGEVSALLHPDKNIR